MIFQSQELHEFREAYHGQNWRNFGKWGGVIGFLRIYTTNQDSYENCLRGRIPGENVASINERKNQFDYD